jgi:hypothetical protein
VSARGARPNSRRPSPRIKLVLGLAAALTSSACGAEFDPASQLEGLRVLAVKKSLPYAHPGQRVELEMSWHAKEPGQIPKIAWLAICENPASDLFQLCFTQLPTFSEAELAERISLPQPDAAQANDHFAFTPSPDIISSRPPAADSSTAPYGLAYVFFAVCSGELEARAGGQLPFVCYEERDGQPGFSDGDVQLDSRDFVVGYTAVFVYEEFTNSNPIISGFEFNRQTLLPELTPDSVDTSSPAGTRLASPDLCIGSSCEPPGADDQARACPDVLTVDACSGACDKVPVHPLVDPSSAEIDAAASTRESGVIQEQMWVNYYSTAGKFGEEVRLLNDATRGWSGDYASDYEPSDSAGVAYVWAVAHDNRGGTEWARLRVCTR